MPKFNGAFETTLLHVKLFVPGGCCALSTRTQLVSEELIRLSAYVHLPTFVAPGRPNDERRRPQTEYVLHELSDVGQRASETAQHGPGDL